MPTAQVALDTAQAGGVATWAVHGALEAVAASPGLRVLLVGPEEAVRAVLPADASDHIEVVGSGPAVDPDHDPAVAVRARRDASIRVAADLVADGRADALVTVGPVGAAVTVAQFALRRLPGMRSPLLAATVEVGQHQLLLTDAGASDGATAGALVRAAELALPLVAAPRPRIGLLAPRGRAEAALRDAASLLDSAIATSSHADVVGTVTAAQALTGAVDLLLAPGAQGALLLDAVSVTAGPETVQPAAVLLGVAGTVVTHIGQATPDALATSIAHAAVAADRLDAVA